MATDDPTRVPLRNDQLAHELNNLLDGSLRSIHQAQKSIPDTPDQAMDRLTSTERLLERMVRLVEGFGQTPQPLDAGQPPVIPSDTPQTLGEALDHALRATEAFAEERGVELDAMADPRLISLPADALYTVASNALKNAVESIEQAQRTQRPERARDRIELRLESDGEDIVLRISDTGDGIDDALIAPGGGFRFGVTTKPDGHGIGLGLSKQIAAALRGRLWLRDQSPRGAVLTLRFPAAALQPHAATPPRGATP